MSRKLPSEDEEWDRDEIEDSESWRNWLPLRLADDDYKYIWSGSNINKVNGE